MITLYCAVCLVSSADPNRLTEARTIVNGTATCMEHVIYIWRLHYPKDKR